MIDCMRTRVRKQPIIALYFKVENERKPIIALYFEFETVLNFYILEARTHLFLFSLIYFMVLRKTN